MKETSQKIALTLRNLRKERGWSLDKTAAETGVSKAMLGQIEREESSPTVSTLWKIATGFQVSFSSFLEAELSNSKPVYRSGKVKKLNPQDAIQITPIFPFDSKLKFEVFIIELQPGSEHLSLPHEPGVIEHVIVTEGIMEVLSQGRWKKLSKGKGLRFNADEIHGYRNKTDQNVIFHNIIYYPNKSSA